MKMLALSPFAGLASLAPLVVRVIVGVIMTVHGFQKLVGGPATSGRFSGNSAYPCRRSWPSW